jgi:hypothetical protein
VTAPSPPAPFVRRRPVRGVLAARAAERDAAGRTPYAEVALLKDAGLVTLLGPVEHGGGGQEWHTAYRVIREVAAGFRDRVFTPRTDNTMNVPTIQLVFVSFYLGIARGALEEAADYTRTTTRAWLHGGHSRAVDEPYVIDTYGDVQAKLWAAEALADAVAAEALPIHRDPDALTERVRGEHEVRVAAVKARATEVALEITSGIVEVLGARATTASLRFDRFWRNVRTHTLHDPVDLQTPRGRSSRPRRRAARAGLVQLSSTRDGQDRGRGRQRRGRGSPTSLPVARSASMTECASRIRSSGKTCPSGTVARPAATSSRNSCSTGAGRSLASPA